MAETKRILRKICAVTLCAAMLCSTAAFGEAVGFVGSSISGIVASAAEDDIQETAASSFEFEENEDGTITITKFIGSETEVVIPSKIDGKDVTSIGLQAFYYNSELRSVTIPDSVTSIGWGAFDGCSRLISINIPDGVTSIEYATFRDCDRLSSITIGKNVKSIGEWAFLGCDWLEDVTIGKSVTSIGVEAFAYCRFLTSINIPNSVTSIGKGAFIETALTNITIPDSVTSIAEYAFLDSRVLKSAVIPDSVTSIGEYALGYYAYDGDYKKIDDFTIYGKPGTAAETYANENGFVFIDSSTAGITGECTWKYDEEAKQLMISGSGATAYYENAADQPWNGLEVEKIVIGDGVKSLGAGLFTGSAAESVEMADSVVNIGMITFQDCKNLKNIRLSSNLREIGGGAFQNCTSLREFNIPDSVKSLGPHLFSGCRNLENISFTDSIESIGADIFEGTAWLRNLPDGDFYVGKIYAGHKGALPADGTIRVKSGTTAIGTAALFGRSDLKRISIPASVSSSDFAVGPMSIGFWFDESSETMMKISDLVIEGVSGSPAEKYATENGFAFQELATSGTTGSCAWGYDTERKSLTISGDGETDYYPDGNQPWCSLDVQEGIAADGVKALRAGVFNGLGVRKVTIAASVKTIGMIAFMDCKNLEEVILSEGLEEINGGAFNGCSNLRFINLPSTIKRYGPFAFGDCEKLSDFNFDGQVLDDLGAGAFSGTAWFNDLPDGDVYVSNAYYTYKGYAPENTTIEIKPGTTLIGAGALAMQGEQPGFVGVILPDGLETLGENSLYGCASLKSLTIPASVTRIDDHAFGYHRDHQAEEDVKFEGIKIIGKAGTEAEKYASDNGFEFIEDLDYEYTENDDGSITITKFTGSGAQVVIPAEINRKPVTAIGPEAFRVCSSLISVTIPDSVTSIGESAFLNCASLVSVRFGNGLKTIGKLAFGGCTTLENVDLTSGVTTIGDQAFFRCSQLRTIVIPESVTEIGTDALPVDSELVIHSRYGSFAESYANSKGFSFVDDLHTEHTAGEVIHEHETPATCAQPGSYDEVVRCSVCGEEISRETKTIPATGIHTPGEKTRENEVPATCTKAGHYDEVVRCSVCGEEISRETKTIPAAGHTPGQAVKENEKAPVCTDYGSYILTIKCTICGEELSREKVTIPATGHDWGEWKVEGNKEVRVCKNDPNHKETKDIKVTSVKLNKSVATITAGKTVKLTATISPSNATNQTLTWTTSNKSVATVSDGTVKGLKAGKATITVKTANGKKATCQVNVKAVTVNASSVKLNQTNIKLAKGKTFTLKATISPSNTTNKKLTWTTSNKKVATVDSNGKVKAIGKGSATITVKTANGKKATCKVGVTIPATKVTLNKTKATLKVGKKLTLRATKTPSNSTDDLKWESSSTKIATVKNGTVTAKKAGTVTITVRTTSGKTAKCKITVKK